MKPFFFAIFIIFFSLTGCLNSPRIISIKNSKGEAIKQCMVLAIESNMFYPNRKGIFYSDHKGQVHIPYHGFVLYYVGKEGYKISLRETVDSEVNITIFNDTQKVPENTIILKSIGVPYDYLSEISCNPSELNYFSSTNVIMLLSNYQSIE